MLRNRLPYFAWVLLLTFVPGECRGGQILRVHIVNTKDGKPLKNETVTVSFLYEGEQPAPPLQLQTDQNGEAVFNLPEPAPMDLDIRVKLKSEYWHCGCMALVVPKDIIQKGFTTATEASGGLKPGPGEILFVARPYSLWERILAPLVKWAG
jgi:hypothetical protein